MLFNEADQLASADPADWVVAPGWRQLVDEFFSSAEGLNLRGFLSARVAAGAIIFPPQPLRALALTPPEEVQVVILGQDPYHGPGQAEGLAFSVAPGIKLPPSLRNIYKELARDPSIQNKGNPVTSGSLTRWAEQGVLLLNTCLTVEDGLPASHAKQGWEALTDEIIKAVWALQSPVAFLLWGTHAQTKQTLIATRAIGTVSKTDHLVLTANHPSPLSALRPPAPFIGCGHFGRVNAFLTQQGASPIDW